MGVAGEEGGVIFQGGGLLVEFLHENKLNSEIFKEKKSLLTKTFSSVGLNTELSYF